jgi:hypothetical protein
MASISPRTGGVLANGVTVPQSWPENVCPPPQSAWRYPWILSRIDRLLKIILARSNSARLPSKTPSTTGVFNNPADTVS